MIELGRHIEILLLNNDCVIVPDLGGFMAHHVEARHDDGDNLFLPPLRTLGFNPKLDMNDSLLAQSYIEAYDISYPDAIQRIENEVNELKQHLENEGSYELVDIGILYMNDNGNYEFTPCEAGILTPELYGLYSFDMPQISEDEVENPQATIAVIPETEPVLVDDKAYEKESATCLVESQNNEEHDDNECKTIKIRVDVLRNVVAAAIAIFAFFFVSTPMGDSTNGIKTMNMSNGVIYRLMPKDITLQSEQAVPTDKKPDAKPETEKATEKKVEEKAESEKIETKHTPYYTIVLASRVMVKNATAYVDKLHEEGLKEASVYRSKDNGTKVIYGHYATEGEAFNALRELRNAGDTFSQGWIYKVKE